MSESVGVSGNLWSGSDRKANASAGKIDRCLQFKVNLDCGVTIICNNLVFPFINRSIGIVFFFDYPITYIIKIL